jgi:WD40 repeat protein/serine/threonine protein kinase
MAEKRYCIICGGEVQSDDPDVVFCPEHEGPTQTAPSVTQSQETTWEVEEEEFQPQRDRVDLWQPGQTLLDTYEVVGKLGEGGMGLVYRVHHKSWNMDLAVKQPKASLFATQKGKEDFIREAETWVNLGLHPHITSCYYVRMIDDIPHIFVEFMEGGSLEDWIQRKGQDLYEGGPEASLERILDIAIQFAWGLAYAHEQGLVHQDVKPLNVLMTPEGVVKVTDFGLAKARAKAGESADGKERRALVSGSLHTVAYRSPEQAKGEMLSHKTDIWSWAVSVLEMFEGGVYWHDGQSAGTSLETYLRRGSERDHPIMPKGLIGLMRQCFQIDPNDRPSDMLVITQKLVDIYAMVTGIPYTRQKPDPIDLRAASLNNKALSFLDLNNSESARNAWKEALEKDEHHPEATYNHGMWLWQKGEKTDLDLVNQLHEIVMDRLDNWKPIYLLGLVHIRQRDVHRAEKTLNKALSLSSKNKLIITELNDLENIVPIEGLGYIRSKGTLLDMFAGSKYDAGIILYPENYLRVWDLDHNKYTKKFEGHSDKVQCAAFSENGSKVVSYSKDGRICTWAFDGEVKLLKRINIEPEYFNLIAFSPNESEILLGFSRHMYLVDLQSGHKQKILSKTTTGFTAFCFSPKGDTIIAGSESGLLHLIPIHNTKQETVLDGHSGSVRGLAISHAGQHAISGSTDQTIRVWNLEINKCENVFLGHTGVVKTLAYSGDDSLIVSGSSTDNSVRLWDAESGQCLRTFEGHEDGIDYVIFRHDSKHIISGCNPIGHPSEVVYWKFVTPNLPEIKWKICQPSDSVKDVSVTRLIKSKRNEFNSAYRSGSLHQAAGILLEIIRVPGYENDPGTLDLLHKVGSTIGRPCGIYKANMSIKKSFEGGWPKKISFSPDGSMLAIPTIQGVELRNSKSLDLIRSIKIFSRLQTCCGFTLDGEKLITGNMEGKLQLIDLKTGKRISLDGHQDEILTIEVAPDGQTILTGSEDGTLKLWHLESGKCVRTMIGDSKPIQSCAITPNGDIAISGGFKLQYWDLKTGKEIPHKYSSYRDYLSMSPDGRLLITSDDGEFEVVEFKTGYRVFRGRWHKGNIQSIAISTDGRFVFTGSEDQTIRIWDINKKECLRYLEGHTHPTTALALSPNMRQLVTCNHSEMFLWSLDWVYEYPDYSDWDENAEPYLEQFLTIHTQYDRKLPEGKKPTIYDIRRSLFPTGTPNWSEPDFQNLLTELGRRGFGWLREDGVRRKLEEMAAERG